MNKLIKILILTGSINLCCSDNIINKKTKALVILNIHKEDLKTLDFKQELCYLPDTIRNILFTSKKNNIFNLVSVNNKIEQILPTLSKQNQIDILTDYCNKIDSGTFLVYLIKSTRSGLCRLSTAISHTRCLKAIFAPTT